MSESERPAAPGDAGGIPPSTPPTAQVPGPTPPGPPAGQTPRSHKWQLIAAVVVVVAIAGAVGGYFASRSSKSSASAQNASSNASAASAASGASGASGSMGVHRFHGVAGTIAAINGDTITLNTQTGVAKVRTTPTTAVTVTSSGSVSDIATGDRVIVSGTKSGTTIAADTIGDVGKNAPAGPGLLGGNGRRLGRDMHRFGSGNGAHGGPSMNGRSFAAGTVTAANGSTLTVKAADGATETVTTTSSTKVTITKAGSLSDLHSGDQITVMGKTSNGVTTANRIMKGRMGFVFGREGNGGPGGFGPPAGGGPGNGSGIGGD